MELAQDKRGQLKEMKYLTPTRSALVSSTPRMTYPAAHDVTKTIS
jgi:hypothetical protein